MDIDLVEKYYHDTKCINLMEVVPNYSELDFEESWCAREQLVCEHLEDTFEHKKLTIIIGV